MTYLVRSAAAALFAVFLLGVSGITGCPFMTDPDDGDDPIIIHDFRARTSPENILFNLKQAYKLRNIAEYESLLALKPPAFTFVLSADDQGQPGMPDQWGRQTEIDIHTHMFDAEAVQKLELDFVEGTREWDATNNMWSILITNVNLHLGGIIPGQEEDGYQELEVEGSTSRFWFREENWTESGTSNKIWSIVKWEDNPAGS